MNVRKWFQKRSPGFIIQRGKKLLARYDLTGPKAKKRVEQCIAALATRNCSPTFFVPGIVVERHSAFIRHLFKLGAEIGVHGYNHFDLNVYPPADARDQLLHAVRVFERNQLEVNGFRCPYLSYSNELLNAIPQGVFQYSSNRAVRWDISEPGRSSSETMVETIDRFYTPLDANSTINVPWLQNSMVEIPVCVPDDLQLMDGYRMSLAAVTRTWIDLFDAIYQRGELFNLMFHPELSSSSIEPFLALLDSAGHMNPKVWVSQLAEIGKWWAEKAQFSVDITPHERALDISLSCSPRATVLCRELRPANLDRECIHDWDGRYDQIAAHSFSVPDLPRPLLGISPDIPPDVTAFLQDQGYILDRTSYAHQCSVFLDSRLLGSLGNRVQLIDWIENTPGPLIRFGRWPGGCKSALCVSGDLDALSLLDYATRLVKKS